MDRKPYPSDLTDERWALLEPLPPRAEPGGRPRSVDLREVANAMLYLPHAGRPWRSLPHDPPPWGTVRSSFRRRRDDGTLDPLHDAPRAGARTGAGRDPDPSPAILDGQSVETAEKGGRAAPTPARRFRGASTTLSSIPWDQCTACRCRRRTCRTATAPKTCLRRWSDGCRGWGGSGPTPGTRGGRWTGCGEAGWELEVVAKPPGAATFAVLPERRIVGRTFAWLGTCRRPSEDHEPSVASSEALIKPATIGLTARRLAPA